MPSSLLARRRVVQKQAGLGQWSVSVLSSRRRLQSLPEVQRAMTSLTQQSDPELSRVCCQTRQKRQRRNNRHETQSSPHSQASSPTWSSSVELHEAFGGRTVRLALQIPASRCQRSPIGAALSSRSAQKCLSCSCSVRWRAARWRALPVPQPRQYQRLLSVCRFWFLPRQRGDTRRWVLL